MRRRLARALAAPEAQPQHWEEAFYRALQHACPGGRIMANAGAEHLKANASTINCTVSQTLDDSMAGIMRAASDAALTLKRSEEHTSELQSLMRISYAVFCLKKKNQTVIPHNWPTSTMVMFVYIILILTKHCMN